MTTVRANRIIAKTIIPLVKTIISLVKANKNSIKTALVNFNKMTNEN